MTNNGLTTYIESLGVYLPHQETASATRVKGIRSGIKVPLERLTGIKSTRRVEADEFSYDLACRAIEASLRRSSFRAEDIGVVIACNISKYDRAGFTFAIEPNTATRLRKALGFKNALAFDVNNACAGMFTGILVADCLLHMTDIAAALVVSGEFISHLSETAQQEITSFFDPRLACLTLGDSGAAAVLARSPDRAAGFQHFEMFTLGAHSGLCRSTTASGSDSGAVMITDSSELLKVGSIETARHFVESLDSHGWPLESVDHVIPHQVSKGATDSFVKQINSHLRGGKLPKHKVVDNLPSRGNTATTTHMVALHDHIEKQRIGAGDRVVFSVTASGLTVGSALYVLDDLPARLQNGHHAANGKAPAPATQQALRSVSVATDNDEASAVSPAQTPESAAVAAAATSANNETPAPSTRQGPRSVTVASIATTRARQSVAASTEDIALEAAEACLAQAPCGREDIGMLLFTGVFKSGFLAEPSYAAILAGELFPNARNVAGSPAALAFDLHAGPNGFLTACEILRTMVGRRSLRAGLVIAAEFDENRLIEGYPAMGIAEVASAAVIMPPETAGVRVEDCRFFTFDEFGECFRADTIGVKPVHIAVRSCAKYQASLRACVVRAIHSYLAAAGRTLAEFDELYLPQVSPEFLRLLGKELAVPRERIVDVTIDGQDLYTSSLPCILETAAQAGLAGSGKVCLAVSAGTGINVGCAVVRG